MLAQVHLQITGHLAYELEHVERVWSQGLDTQLSPAQTSRRHHLHGLGDLLRILDRADPSTYVSL
jgi:hypothetical protein